MAKRKKRHEPDSAAKTLDEIEREGDRLTEWMVENRNRLLAGAGAILLTAGGVGVVHTTRQAALEEAATRYAELQGDYREAMGASRGAFEIAEPANPETARVVRDEYLTAFDAFASENEGSPIGALAALDQAQIQEAMGDRAAAVATVESALAAQPTGAGVRTYLNARLGLLHERGDDFAKAASAWEAAASQPDPLQSEALANAARCWTNAGEIDRALAVWARLQAMGDSGRVPPYIEARLAELEAGA